MSSPSWDYIAKLVCIGDSGCGKSSLTIRLCEGRFSPHHDVTIGVEFGSRIVPVGPPHSATLPSPSFFSTSQPTTVNPHSPTTTVFDSTASQDPSSPSTTVTTGLPEPPRKTPPPVPQKHMKLSLWDTAGQETYKSVTRSYFRGASGALLVFDLSRRQTFEHVTDWLQDLRQIAEPDIVVILVGNKADLVDEEQDTTATSTSTSSQTTISPSESLSTSLPSKKNSNRQVSRQEACDWARRNGVLEYVETSAKSGENVEMAFMRVAERIYQNILVGKYDLNDRRSGVKGASSQNGGTSLTQGVRGTGGSGDGGILLGSVKKATGGGCC